MLNAIFSDIHSNLQAYEAFLKDAKNEGIEKYYCIGDIVGYGANPKECLNLTRQLNCPLVCGNHDWAVCGNLPLDYFNLYAKEAIEWTKSVVEESDKNYLSNLPFIFNEKELTLVHGSLDAPEDFNHILETSDAQESFQFQNAKLCFIGHTHIPGVFLRTKNNYINYTTEPQVSLDDGVSYIVNAGSIGQPRDGYWRGCYCVYDDEKDIVRFRRIEYDVKGAGKAIAKAGLPAYLAERILRGK